MRAADVLEYLARHLVDEPDAVEVEIADENGNEVVLELIVAPDDVGKVIGRRGRTAKALRTVVRAAGQLDGDEVDVESVD